MHNGQFKVSRNYQKNVLRAIGSIVFFIFSYLVVIALAIGLTIVLGYFGIFVIAAHPAFFTLLIGAGLVSTGVFILIFLLKFLFNKQKTDDSNLLQVTRKEEPVLFELIDEVAAVVQTSRPKKVYLASDVNASVFYDSSFWSLFLPVKKNLMIGIGLVNTVTVNELRAILAHEFGHFSQRSMKVGSYVYQVNQVIFNLLYKNESLDNLMASWARLHWFLLFFVRLAGWVIRGIQWLLRRMYEVVNISYLALSREMEFHADAVAARVAGSQPMIDGLLRIELSNNSFQSVLEFYNEKITGGIKTENIYPQHKKVLLLHARQDNLEIENGLPKVSVTRLGKYNKSKLVVKDQWASHPGVKERVAELQKLNIPERHTDDRPGASVFQNFNALESTVTEKLFSTVQYEQETNFINDEEFFNDYASRHEKIVFDPLFNGYYDHKNPPVIGLEFLNEMDISEPSGDIDSFFSDAMVESIYDGYSLQGDISYLNYLDSDDSQIKTFDYDGIRYRKKDIKLLIEQLEKESIWVRDRLFENDKKILRYFLALARRFQKEETFILHYQHYLKMDKRYDESHEIYIRLANETRFIHETTPFEKIESSLEGLKETEKKFRQELISLMESADYNLVLTPEIKDSFNAYLEKEWVYFLRPDYDDVSLSKLFAAMNDFQKLLIHGLNKAKFGLLDFQVQIEMEGRQQKQRIA